MHEIDTKTFEHLHGERPWQLLDRHPVGRHVAMQVTAILHTTVERAAVWDLTTGKLAWAPSDVNALAWLPGGVQLALIREHYSRSPDHPAIIGTPLQSEHAYTFERLTWPTLTPIDSCPLTFPMGWPTDLMLSPRGDLAVVQWSDQQESGLEFIDLAASGPRQIQDTGLPQIATLMGGRIPNGGGFPLNSALSFRPVYSPDGRYIVIAWQDEWVWWNGEDDDAETPSSGGDYTIGTVSILDWQKRTHHAIPLREQLSPGWLPEPREDGGEGLLDDILVFLDATHVSIHSPTGKTHTFSVGET